MSTQTHATIAPDRLNVLLGCGGRIRRDRPDPVGSMMLRSHRRSGFRARAGACAALVGMAVAAALSTPGKALASVSSLTQGKGIRLSPNPITSTGTISLALPLSLTFSSTSQIFSLTNTSTAANASALRAKGNTYGIFASASGAGGVGVFAVGGANGYGLYGQGGGQFAGVLGQGGPSDGNGGGFVGTASGITDHVSTGAGLSAAGASANPTHNFGTDGGTGVSTQGGSDSQPPAQGGVVGTGGIGLLARGGAGSNGNIGGAGIDAFGGAGVKAGGDGIDASAGSGPGARAGNFVGNVNISGTLTADKLVVVSPLAFQTLSLLNGWTGGPFGTASPAAAVDAQGIVHLRGGMSQAGTFSPTPFILPSGLRPSHVEYVPVDMANAATGRIEIDPDGTVRVEDKNDSVDAQDFTSLDGVTYALG